MEKNNLYQQIEGDTRNKADACTKIYLIFTNIVSSRLRAGVVQMGITDHNAIFININHEVNSQDKKENTNKSFQTNEKFKDVNNHDQINREVRERNWQNIGNDPEEQIKNLQAELSRIISRNTIRRKLTNHYNRKKYPWMNNNILKDIRKRDKLIYKTSRESESGRKSHMQNQIKIRSRRTQEKINTSRNNYFRSEFAKANGNMKKIWKTMNSMMEPGKSSSNNVIDHLDDGDTEIAEGKEMANKLNNTFVNIAVGNNSDIKKRLTMLNIKEGLCSCSRLLWKK